MDTVLVLALLIICGYIAACAWWPFAACLRCHGTAKLRSPSGKAWRHCPRCAGTGRRVRVGRRVYEAMNGHRSDT